MLLVLLASAGLSVALYELSGGQVIVFVLPFLVALPMVGRGRRR
jgi:hypothetical protein